MDRQTTNDQRLALEDVAKRRGWTVARSYEDAGTSSAKVRAQRSGLDTAMEDAYRHRFDVLIVWSVDQLGRHAAEVAAALEELQATGAALYADKEGVDATTCHGRAMVQMAAVFAELERSVRRKRVEAGLARARAQGRPLGRPRVASSVEDAIRAKLAEGKGLKKVSEELGVGVSTVQRIRREMDAMGKDRAAE